ncbi:hypothetical protein SHJG_1390 [Streptomyces hygroscopicus subsp. jinggangensis 5008]|nr:hypothetical protein SHJG_1390 [Streptomyces hygroscopicus subsp. jinggangensis 5008]AGF60890.1 hypothetical protein SHJGH_1224 [Streptomyces hygroscopicus subsp. jinggangensis TL01]
MVPGLRVPHEGDRIPVRSVPHAFPENGHEVGTGRQSVIHAKSTTQMFGKVH